MSERTLVHTPAFPFTRLLIFCISDIFEASSWLALTESKKKKSDINTSSALISHFDWTLLVELTVALKAGVYPKQDNSVRDGGFPINSSLAGPSPSYIVVAPYIRRYVSSIKAGSPKWGVILFSYL